MFQEVHLQTLEHFADEDSDSQLTDLSPSESQLENSISPDELDVPDMH